MGKIPKSPDEIFEAFTNEYKSAFGDNLISIILYGSAARGEYVYKKSDINFMIVLSDQGIRDIRKAHSLVKRWQKRNAETPLMLTKGYIESSLDSFPIEFLTMRESYQVVYGEDVLADIKIDTKDLRLQCERELRGKLLHLRESYLNTYGKKKSIQELMTVSLPTFTSIFSGLLYLKGQEIPSSKTDILKSTSEEFNLNYNVFEQLVKLRNNSLKLGSNELNDLMENYIEQIRKLTITVDAL